MYGAPSLTLRFRARYEAAPRTVRAIRADVEEIARDCGVEGECLEEVRLAISEVARDAVSGAVAGHGYVHVSVEIGDGELVLTASGDGASDEEVRMSVPCTPAVDRERASATERLTAAVAEHARLTRRLDAADIRIGAAGDRVAARQAWAHWVDDAAYRGLNAGPFELKASSVELLPTAGSKSTIV